MEPLREQVGRALYEEPGFTVGWSALSEERREPWRKDADRVIPLVEKGLVEFPTMIGMTDLEARLAGLAIGLEQKQEPYAAHLIRVVVKELHSVRAERDRAQKACAQIAQRLP